MNLKELVPPLELCKKIPAGEFEDSALVYSVSQDKILQAEIFIDLRELEEYRVNQIKDDLPVLDPAPTLQEIMAKLPCTVKTDFIGDEFHIYNDVKNGYGVTNENPVIAALTLWLRLKGIEK